MRASRFTIYKSKCYDQALAGKMMLKRRGVSSTLYFGLSKVDTELTAHAWLRTGDRVITGRSEMKNYTSIAWYGDTVK